MNIENEIDNWTEDDFKLPKAEISLVDDPWFVDSRSKVPNSTESPLGDLEDDTTSKESAPPKPGIYIPNVDRIRPYVQPASERIDQYGARTPSGVENAVGASAPRDGRSTDVANLTESAADKPQPAEKDAAPTRIPRAQHQLHLPLSPSVSQARREPNLNPISQEEADLLVDSAFKGVTCRRFAPGHPRRYVLELEEDDLPFFDDWFDSHSPNEGDDQDALRGYEEPEPNAEYDAGLHEALHQATRTTRNLRRTLEIDEWLSEDRLFGRRCGTRDQRHLNGI